ncbi:MAG: c-type cytochrome domain-containing protein, partial [Verrucomicrobiales bacterium]
MNRLARVLTVAAGAGFGIAPLPADTYTPGEPIHGDYGNFAEVFLDNHCFDCHDGETKKGDLNLVELGPVDETNAAVWKSVWAQVSLQEMPPKKKQQPGAVERLRFSDWIVGELKRVMEHQGGFQAHLDPHKGNFVDHDLLFGPLPDGVELAPTSSPARIWRVTPQEHITRLNELINTEPEFDPSKPGVRTRGDAVPTNHGGELKLYFGTDRITRWQGGTVAYATSVKSVPVVLSSARKHGFENYPDFYTVNSAEATQILDKAEDILRYMAYGPLSLANPEQITDDPKTYQIEGDLRGLPTAITYSTKFLRPLTPVFELMKDAGADDERLRSAVDYVFEALTFRPPTRDESSAYLDIVKNSIDKVGKEDGVFMGLSSIFLDRDALFRPELVEDGKPDAHGRVMLQDWELGLAVNHALSYIKPDAELRQAIVEGRMRTRQDVEREVTRILADNSIRKPRILR